LFHPFPLIDPQPWRLDSNYVTEFTKYPTKAFSTLLQKV
jgi:hypothetical protein